MDSERGTPAEMRPDGWPFQGGSSGVLVGHAGRGYKLGSGSQVVFQETPSEIIVSPEHSPDDQGLVVPALPRGHLLSRAMSAHSGQVACPLCPLAPSQCSQPLAVAEIICVLACRVVNPRAASTSSRLHALSLGPEACPMQSGLSGSELPTPCYCLAIHSVLCYGQLHPIQAVRS